MTQKLKSSIITDIDMIIKFYEPYLNQLSEDEKKDIEQLKTCSKVLCGENKSFSPSVLTYIFRTIN